MRMAARFAARRHGACAALLACVVVAAAVSYGVRVAGGADSYGYVSEAELWLKGDLHVDQSAWADAPWPDARRTFTPLGYRAAPQGWSIVAGYPPGLPLLMAAAKTVGGQRALFCVVPLCGGILVLTTYGIGRGVGRPVTGLVAAALVATSPVVGYMVMWPMSDVPAAAFWTLAAVLVLRDTPMGAVAAGAAAAAAILIRPNLVPVAAVLAGWTIWHDHAAGRWKQPQSIRSIPFITLAAAGALFVAVLNTRLYGSPLETGYAGVSNLYTSGNISGNLQRYFSWLVMAETPLGLAGLIALVMPWPRLWRTTSAGRAHWLLAGCAVVVWASYVAYVQFDTWWYLRFLLPSWPMIALGSAAVLGMVFHGRRTLGPWVVACLLAAVSLHGTLMMWRSNAFTFAGGESKYAETGRVVAAVTPPEAVIIAMQHSGSVRYYGGRMSVRWDSMDPDWLDRAVAWFAEHGHHPYVLLDNWEIETFKGRHASAVVGRLDWAPIVTFRDGNTRLYDAVQRDFTGPSIQAPRMSDSQCPAPAAPPQFRRP